MGGNVIVKDINGNDVEAVKVDLKAIGRSNVISSAQEVFSALNTLHDAKFGQPIWKDAKVLKDALVFNGSSSFVLSSKFSDEEVLKFKSTMGDIDIAIPAERAETLFELLGKLQGKHVSASAEFVGMNRTSSAALGTQINCIFRFLKPVEYLVQVDFEFLPFEDTGMPTEWARFSHSSSFEDAKDGVKAVHHKYLIRSLVGGISVRPDITIATAKSTYDNVKITAASKKGDVARMLKFSVDHGVRVAYEPLLDPEGKEITVDGKTVYKEIPTSESDYKKTLIEIFKLVFNDEDSSDVGKLWTFRGVIELCGKYLTKSQQKDVAERYFALLWGDKPQRAQELERGNPEADLAVKSGGWNLFKKLTGVKDPSNFEQILQKYYEGYRMNESAEGEPLDVADDARKLMLEVWNANSDGDMLKNVLNLAKLPHKLNKIAPNKVELNFNGYVVTLNAKTGNIYKSTDGRSGSPTSEIKSFVTIILSIACPDFRYDVDVVVSKVKGLREYDKIDKAMAQATKKLRDFDIVWKR